MAVFLAYSALHSAGFADPAISSGPSNGALIAVGGGALGSEIVDRFFDLAGGRESPIVYIPSAGAKPAYKDSLGRNSFFKTAGATDVTVLHTRDRTEADSAEFVAPLRRAKGVWFAGGRQWRLVDAYAGTLTETEIAAVLDRGGVIGGSSAGATIQGSYLVRGARVGNQIMMAPGYEKGFGYLSNCAVDQHLIARGRINDLVSVIRAHTELLGIGIDESTAIVVQGDQFEVIGKSKVAIYHKKLLDRSDAPPYEWLTSGERFDLRERIRISE